MNEPEFKEFNFPDKMLKEIYELTGGADCYKGFIMAHSNEEGDPVIYSTCDSQMTESALIKCMEDFIKQYTKNSLEISQDSQ